MALPGQASGDFTESSSALRILYVGHRNSFAAQLVTDGFTQTNPPVVTGAATVSTTLPVAPKRGVLGGSVCFTRGNGLVGGPTAALDQGEAVLGLFINDAAGNAYENSPAAASGQAPYVSGQGTMGLRLYETQNLDTGALLSWDAGDSAYASLNGYLTNIADANNAVGGAAAVLLGVVKVEPDSVHAELVIDLRV
jgi:hypothetical protein